MAANNEILNKLQLAQNVACGTIILAITILAFLTCTTNWDKICKVQTLTGISFRQSESQKRAYRRTYRFIEIFHSKHCQWGHSLKHDNAHNIGVPDCHSGCGHKAISYTGNEWL